MVVGFTTTLATKVVSLSPVHGEVYSIQHYVISFVSDLWQVGGFSPGTLVSSTNKTDSHDITEIVLKVALNIYNSNPNSNRIHNKLISHSKRDRSPSGVLVMVMVFNTTFNNI